MFRMWQSLTVQLFDMDGTIIDSTEAVVKNWQRYEHADEVGSCLLKPVLG